MGKIKIFKSVCFRSKGLRCFLLLVFFSFGISIALVAQSSDPLVLRPSAGEELQSGGKFKIEWMNIRGSQVNISLIGHGMVARKIATQVANNGAYTWNISCSLKGKDFVIWVMSTGTDSRARSSVFDIVDPRRVIAPTTGAKITTGVTYAVKWQGIYGKNVRITLTRKNTNMTSHLALSTFNTGTYRWQVPSNLKGDDFQLWIRDVSQQACVASSGYFSIQPSTGLGPFALQSQKKVTPQVGLTVGAQMAKLMLRPKGNEMLKAGSAYEIKWTGLQGGPDLRIILIKDNQFHSNLALGAKNTGSFTWNIGPVEHGQNYQIKVTGYPQNTGDFVTSQPFVIVLPPLVTKPGSYFTVNPGKKFFINWRNFTSNKLDIELWQNGTLKETIAHSAPNSKTYEWLVADHYQGYGFQIKIKSSTISEEFAFSEPFKIQ